MSLQDANPINEYSIKHQVRNEPLVYYKRVLEKIIGGTEKVSPICVIWRNK